MWTRLLTAAGVTAAAVGLLWVLFGPLPALLGGADLRDLTPAERITATSTIRGQIGTVLSAAFVGGGLYYTGRRFFLERDKQFTDRFNAAVDHLGSDNDIVRAGGVRALDRILHDSPTDRNRVLETLTDFVRHHSVTRADTDLDRTDITAATAAFRNRPRPPKNITENPLDLHGARLPNANLRAVALTGVDLTGATLTTANLTGADLRHARLNHTTLTAADLFSVTFQHADLHSAQLADADLTGANLTHTNLTDADLRHATLTQADLTGATLVNTDLRDTDLRDTTGLTNHQIRRAKVDERTQLPPTITHPLNGPT